MTFLTNTTFNRVWQIAEVLKERKQPETNVVKSLLIKGSFFINYYIFLGFK